MVPLPAGQPGSGTIRILPPTGGCAARVGGVRVAPLSRNASLLELRALPAVGAGASALQVSLNGLQFGEAAVFSYYDWSISAVLPAWFFRRS